MLIITIININLRISINNNNNNIVNTLIEILQNVNLITLPLFDGPYFDAMAPFSIGYALYRTSWPSLDRAGPFWANVNQISSMTQHFFGPTSFVRLSSMSATSLKSLIFDNHNTFRFHQLSKYLKHFFWQKNC